MHALDGDTPADGTSFIKPRGSHTPRNWSHRKHNHKWLPLGCWATQGIALVPKLHAQPKEAVGVHA